MKKGPFFRIYPAFALWFTLASTPSFAPSHISYNSWNNYRRIAMKKKHQPPSKIKYNQSHPTVSIRVSQELYDELKDLREKSGKSLGDIFREAVGHQAPTVNKAYQRGFANARQTFEVTYRCVVCRGVLRVTSEQEKQAIAQYMREHGWGHNGCIKQHPIW
jgi:hypothetical protein